MLKGTAHMNHSITIRMGAAAWDATLADGTRFDFREMTTEQRKAWYGVFMDTVRDLHKAATKRRSRSKKCKPGKKK